MLTLYHSIAPAGSGGHPSRPGRRQRPGHKDREPGTPAYLGKHPEAGVREGSAPHPGLGIGLVHPDDDPGVILEIGLVAYSGDGMLL